MSSNFHILDLPFDCETSVAYSVHQLINAGLHVSRSFELDSACGSLMTGICFHDPNSPCMCQMVILQVLEAELEPVSIIFHSYNGETEVFLDSEENRTEPGVKGRITQALVF